MLEPQGTFVSMQGASPGVAFAQGQPMVAGQLAEITLAGQPPVGLSSEMLLVYLSGNLEGLDEQIRTLLNGLNTRRQKSGDLTQSLAALRNEKNSAADNVRDKDGEDNDGIELNDGSRARLEAELVAAGFSEEAAESTVESWGGHASSSDIQGAIDTVTDRIGALNNENEYDTLKINDLMGKRSQLIQMVSKMMANMDDTAKAVIQNMR